MPLDLEPLELEPVGSKLDLEPLDLEPVAAQPTSNKLADAARRIPAGVQSGTGRTLAGAVRAGDIAATPTFIPFMGGLGPGAETINRLNQQMPAVREEFVRGRPQRLAESTAFQLGREIEQAAAPTFGVDPARDNEFLAQLATAAGEMVPTLAAGAVAGPAGVAFQYGTSAGEAQAQEAIAAGKPEAADIAFLSAAGLGGITEAALGVPGRLLAIANRARKAGVNPGTFGRWANRNPMAAGIARAGAEGALREGAQEGLEQAGQNLIASDVAGYAPDRPVTEGVGRAMALGATLGGVIGGGSAGLNQAQRNERAALLRTLRDGRQVIVNEQTGTTDFPPLDVDELPAPPVAVPAPNLDPDPALKTLSPTPSAPTTATRGPTGAPAPVADVPRAGESLSPAAPSTFNLQPSTLPDVPGVPPPPSAPVAPVTQPVAPAKGTLDQITREDYAAYLALNPRTPDGSSGQMAFYRELTKRPELRGQKEVIPSDVEKTDVPNRLIPAIANAMGVPNRVKNQWMQVELGDYKTKNADGSRSKLYVTFKDWRASWTPAKMGEFVRLLRQRGFNGSAKTKGAGMFWVAQKVLNKFDDVVVHARNDNDIEIARQAATDVWGDAINFDTGLDATNPSTGEHTSHTDLLAAAVAKAVAKRTPIELPRSRYAPTPPDQSGGPTAKPSTPAPAPSAPALNPTPNPAPISSSLTLEPVADVPDVPGVPPPLEGQPYDTALRTRPEATMESRPAAPLGLQREPAVSPELADAIAAVRGGYNPEVEAQPETSNVQRPTSKPASRKSASELAEEKAARQSLEASLAAEPAEEATAETQRRQAKQMADRVAQEWTTGYTFERNYPISEAKAGQVANALWTEIARMGGKPDDYTVLHDDWVGGQSKGARQRSRMWLAAKVLANLIEQSQSGQRQLESDQNSAKVQVLDLMAKLKAAPTAPAPKTPPDQSGGPSAQPAQAATVGNSAIDAAIAALDAAKIKTQGIYTLPDLGLTVTLWNGSLDAAKLALRTGQSLAQAVEAGINWLRTQGQRFDEARVRTALEQTVKADARIAATKARTVAGRTVGTSNPTTKRRSGEGTDPNHNVSLQRLRARNPEAYRKNALLLTRYPLVAREYPDLAERMRAIDSPYEAAEDRYENAKEKLEEAKSKVEKALAGLLERKANSIKAAEVEAWMRSDPNSKLTVAVRNAQELVATRKAQRDEAADRRSERIDALAKSKRLLPLEDADRIYETYIKVVESNLEALIKLASTTWRDTARLWYDGANLIAQDFARQFGATLEQASAVLAVFSPQKDWFMNVALARRMMNIWQNDQNTRWSPEMTRQFIKRSGEPQPVEDKETGQFVTSPKLVSEWNPDGVKYDKGARPGPPDADGNTTWLNWDNDKAAKNLAEARELLKDLEGRTLAELKDPDLQARFIRMLSEVRDNPNYPKVTPDGQFGELMRNENGKVLKIAWGGYNTIEKAIAVMGSRLELKSGDVLTSEADVISAALGAQHKVRSFYNNIVDPANTSGHVTMDTHAIAALLWMPLSGASPEVTQNFGGAGTMNAGELGIKGMYAANAEAYRRAAVAFSLLPREVQSITWEAVRMLFPAKWKADKTNVAKVRDLWEQYRRNELTIDQARNAVFQLVFGRDLAGAIADDSGVGSPSWTGAMGDSAPDSQAAQETNDARVVSEARGAWGPGSGRGAGSAGSVGGGGNPAAVVRPAAEGVVDSAIAALESAKVKPGGLYALPDLGLTVTLWNGTLTAAQVALRAGRTLAQAVQAGVDWLRAQGQAFDEGEVRKALEQGLLQAPGIREHVGKRLLQEDFSPAAKAALEPLLRYEVKPDAQLFAEAAAVVEAIGPMEAEANYFGNPWGLPADAHVVLGFAIGNGLSTLETQARAAGDTALADRIGRQNAEFQSQFVLQSTETARTLRAYRYFDLVGNLSPFTADLFARKVIEQASQKQKQRIKPALDKGPEGEPGLTDRLNDINRTGIEEAARTPDVQGAARTAINQTIEEEAGRKDTAVERAITLEVSNTLETLPSVVRKANAAVLGAWDKLSAGEQVRQQTGRAGQALENSLWSAIKQRGGAISTVSSVVAQVNRALHEQVNRALGITPQQFVNPTTYLMRLRDALGNAEVMSRIWEQTRAAVGANLAAIGEMEGLLVRIEAEIAELEAEAKTPLAGGPEVTAKDAKLKAQQQAARDEMLKGRNANLADAIKQRRDRIADVTAQLAEYRKMQPAWQAVMGMTVDVWGPNLLRGLLREQMKADGFRLRKAVADHFRGLAGAPDPLQSLGVLRDKLIAASGLDPQAAERLAKDLEAEYTAQVNKERARLAERLAKARELAKAKAAEREAKRPQLDAESLIDAYERRQTEWLKPTGRKSAVRAIVRQALREGAAVAGLNEQVVRGGVQAQLEAVGVPHEAAYRLAYEVWQERQAKGGGIEVVVAARVKELQLDLGRIIRQHWTQVDKAGESLAEHIVGETKMPAEQAERLAAAIQRRFKALVQARKEQALRNLAKTPAARELQKPSVAQRIIEATNLGALDSEGLWQAVADKLGLPTYSAEASAEVKRLADRAQQLPEGSVQRQEATARLMRFIARQKGVNLGDLGWAFWYANTLSGPFTHAVNAFSNVLSLAGNVSTQFRDVRGIPQILAATAKGFRTGLTEARAIVKQGPGANRTKFTEQGQALENLDPQDFTGAGLVSQWRYVARALAASDAAFYFPAREAKAITLARALARQEGKTGAAIRTRAQQILDGTEEQQNLWGAQVDRERAQLVAMGEKPDALWTTRRLEQLREQGWGADIGEAADDFALRTTYNNRPYGLIGTLADVAKFAQNRVPGARGVVPFVNVVANVVNDSINYTPWGFARAYAAGRTGEPSVTLSLPFEWAEKLREGKSPMTPDAVVDLHAKAALGTAMFGSLMAMALANLDDDDGENYQLYGSGPKDAAAKAALRETGWLPYSVRVNGTYVSFANTPLAIPLGALGHYLDAARYDKRFEQADAFNRLGVALWGGAHIITQQSFIDGLARLLGALEERRGRIDTASDRAVEQAFRSISSVAVPNALRQLDRLNDPKIYDARGIEGALVAAIPFARRAGSPALNAFGEPITNEPWKRFASDAEANVWADLARRKIYPSVADKAKNAAGREMTDDEHYRYVQESGQAIKRRLETPGMRQMIRSGKEDDARKAVTAIVREERERARRRLGF